MTLIDFGQIEDGQFKNKNVRIKVCGKTIWSWPSNKSMVRGGWLHYSIIAKGSKLSDAIELCRIWDEFWDLNILAIFQYFSTPTWGVWAGDRAHQQMLQLGFIPYMQFDQAPKHTVSRMARENGLSARITYEARNVIGAHIKRDDLVSRRLVQYLSTRTNMVILMVRDAKTGKVLITPPDNECWLVRHRAEVREAGHDHGDDDWHIDKSISESLFEQVSGKKERDWQFGFTEYYDIIMWDLEPGQPFACLYNTIHEQMFKALRCTNGLDMYEPIAPVVKTLWQDMKTFRVRDAKPGEFTIYDELRRSKFMWGQMGEMGLPMPPNLLYNDVDAAEDLILFPEEVEGKQGRITDRDDPITLTTEKYGPNWRRFVNDLDSDDDSDVVRGLSRTRERDHSLAGSQAPSLLSNEADAVPDDDDASEWLTEPDSDDDSDLCGCEHCEVGDIERCQNPETRKVLFDTTDGDPETLRLALAFEKFEPQWSRDPAAGIQLFGQREAAKVFKKQWHEAVLDPEERAQYEDTQTLVKELLAPTLAKKDRHFCLNLLLWLEMHYHDHRLVWRDMEHAHAMMCIFFPRCNEAATLSERTAGIATSLKDNESRAERLINRRMSCSNLMLPDQYWQQINAVWKTMRREDTDYHRSWDKAMRPVLAHWFKAGAISKSGQLPGNAHHESVQRGLTRHSERIRLKASHCTPRPLAHMDAFALLSADVWLG